jgi:uncharacterized protein
MNQSTPLYHVWNYTATDRDFWREHLEKWMPGRIFDAHTHVQEPEFRLRPMTEEKRRQYWVNEALEPIGAADSARCYATIFPGRQFACLAFGIPDLDYDLDAGNARLQAECAQRGWYCLAVIRPQWTAAHLQHLLEQPRVVGVKVYYTLLGEDLQTRDRYQEASIFDFLPPHQLEVLEKHRAWVTLHVPRAGRLSHPQNIAEIKRIRCEYPGITLVIAHLGRIYSPSQAEETFPLFAEDQGLYFDISAVFHPEVLRLALETFGPQRIIYGTDNPIFYMRGRQQYRSREYVNHTNYPFHFNRQREPAEVEARYTLYVYEALRSLRQACESLRLNSQAIEDIFSGNAERLIQSIEQKKNEKQVK